MVHKNHKYKIGPIWTPQCNGGPVDPKVPKMKKKQPDWTEMKLDGKVPGFYAYWYPILVISENSLVTEKTEKFMPILFLGIFKLDFRIPGKILSGFLVRHMLWCLVTPKTPRGSLRSINTRKRVVPKINSKFFQESENQVLKFLEKELAKISQFSQLKWNFGKWLSLSSENT